MYYEIFEGLVTTVATSAISAGVKNAIERYFGKGPKARTTVENTEYPIISIPLAIGYYYNFIDKIEDRLKGDNLTVKRHYTVEGDRQLEQEFDKAGLSTEQKSRLSQSAGLDQMRSTRHEMTEFLGRFETKAVSLDIIYPKELSNPAIRDCSKFLLEKTNQGSIISTVGGRPWGINYADIQPTESPTIKIVDYARPVEVITKFYQEEKGFGQMDADQELWKEIQDREMQAFLATLKHMISKATFLYNKVYFRPYDTAAADNRG
jgi:hypothetical protein